MAPELFEVPMAQARELLADLSGRVGYRGERIIVTKHGKQVFALISIDDLRRLEKYEVLEAVNNRNQDELVSEEDILGEFGVKKETVTAAGI